MTATRRSALLAAGWLVAVGILFQLFHHWEGLPLRKTALLCVIGVLCLALYWWTWAGRRLARVPALATWIVAATAVLALGNSLVRGIRTFETSRKVGDVFHDQGQLVHRALRLLAHAVNPYGSRTMLDPLAYSEQVHVLSRMPECGDVDPDAALRAFMAYWARPLDSDRMRSLPPAIADSPACRGIRLKFQSLGYHYGPALLLAYAPLVALLGPAGIYAAHLVALLIWLTLLGVWLRKDLVNVAWLPALSAITVFLLGPSHVNYIFLQLAASDLVPTILASAGLMLWLRGRDLPAAVLLAVSVGAKLFPGVLFAPLLARNTRAVLLFVMCAAALYFPFAVWEPAGLYHNLLYPLTNRDATSLLSAVPDAVGTLLRAGAAVSFGAWILRLTIHGWPQREALLFLVCIHLAALGLGGMSHNNYLIWVMSAIAVFWIRLVDGGGDQTVSVAGGVVGR